MVNPAATIVFDLVLIGSALGLLTSMVVEAPPPPVFRSALSDASLHLKKPVSEMELSVRSRKCLQRLGVASMGELAQRSEAELLSIKELLH